MLGFGRLLDAIATRCSTRIDAAVSHAIEAKDASRRAEVRALIGEMEDVLEKFSRVVAREAKRRSRDMKDVLSEAEQRPPEPQVAQSPELSAAQRKALLRSRVAAGGIQLQHRGGDA